MARSTCTGMNIIKHKKPWEHFEVHNFLDTHNFNSVKMFAKNLTVTNDRSMKVLRTGDIYSILSDAMRMFCNSISYCPPADHEITVQLDAIKPGWAYNKVHTDNPKKWVTFVMAISETGTGTHLYSKDRQSLIKTTNWIPNGGYGFIRKNNTWHDFDAIGLSDIRRTAIIMLAEKGWDNV